MRKKKAVSDEIYIASFNERKRTVSNERLQQIFEHTGRAYGYENVTACFYPFPDFKVKWTRTYKRISFEVSDYLDRAPDDVLTSLADTIYNKLSGTESDYSNVLIRYLEDISPENMSDYIKRKRLNDNSVGQYHDLNDCVNRLRGQGLIPPDTECILCWDDQASVKASGCSVIQKIVWVNTALDRKGVPENVLDYAVFNKMAHIIAGYGNSASGSEFLRLDTLYPMRVEAMDWLSEHGMSI